MKTIARLIAVLVIAAVASFHLVSCSTSPGGSADTRAKILSAADVALNLAAADGRLKEADLALLKDALDVVANNGNASTHEQLIAGAKVLAKAAQSSGALTPEQAAAVQIALALFGTP